MHELEPEGGVKWERVLQAEKITCAMSPLGRKGYILLLRGTERGLVRLENRAPMNESRERDEAQPMVREGFL